MNEIYCNENRVEQLKKRKQRCCCKYCGGKLVLKRIVFSDFEDARIEIFCEDCGRIEFGIEKEVYNSAENFVNNLQINFFEGMDDNVQRHRMNVAQVCDIMGWCLRELGCLNQDGFTVPIKGTENLMKACVVIDDADVLLEEVTTSW